MLVEESEINLSKNFRVPSRKSKQDVSVIDFEKLRTSLPDEWESAESFLSCFAMFLKNWLKYIPAKLFFLVLAFFVNNKMKWIADEKSFMSAVGHLYKSVASDMVVFFLPWFTVDKFQFSFFNCGSNEVIAIHLTYLPCTGIAFCIADFEFFA